MTEYEAASLVLQQAAVWVAAVVGAAQCSLIGVGLYIMRRAAIQRDAQHQENMAQHRQTMEELKAQREVQKEQHRETIVVLQAQREAHSEQHRETMKALEGQNNALMELIRRTSGTPAQRDG